MVKQRMTALDVRATVEEMRAQLIGLRLLNIYNISNRMFLFKFGQGENKRSVLLENGIRFHLTELAREKPMVPSQFTLKLRKHIRAWRLDSITQLQHDRTIDMCFGVASTAGCFHIIIELFSKGNVILADHTYKMMTLLRTRRDDEGLNLMVNETYPLTAPFADGSDASATSRAGSTVATSVSGSVTIATAREELHVMLYTPHVDAAGHLHVHRIPDTELSPAQRELKTRRVRMLKNEWDIGLSRSNDRTALQSLVAGIQHFGPDLAQHVLTISGVPNAQLRNWKETPDELFDKILEGLLEAFDLAKVDLTSAGGYLIKEAAKRNAKQGAVSPSSSSSFGVAAAAAGGASASSSGAQPLTTESTAAVTVAVAEQYESFTPILLAQYTLNGVESVYRPGFGRVCDEFFLITETEKIDASNDKRKNAAKSKEEKFAADHARRINGLEADMAIHQQKGEQLILNAERVDEAIQLINGALATGISWDALHNLLKRRSAEGHPVAYMIHELFLERNAISVLLESALDDEEDDCDVPALVVEVSLSKTAHANAADYFGKQKQSKAKLERTVASTEKAAAGAARKGARTAAEQKEKKVIVKDRQRNWWEKFFWFRTTAGDLVLRGKDVQSTELLLRRVKKLGDFFVQCDVNGSLPCLVRPLAYLWHSDTITGPSPTSVGPQPIAAASLCEAGAWCVAFSGAWETKQTTGAWWIYASQVTGGSAAGTYIFSGERHYLLPQPMSLGCALLFYVTRTVDQAAPLAVRAVAEDGEKVEEELGGAEEQAAEQMDEEHRNPEGLLRQELPRLPTKTQLHAAATDATTADTSSNDVIPADAAAALADMPSIEAFRAEQRRQQQTYSGYVGHHSSSGGGARAKNKKSGVGYARNARVDRAALQGGFGAASDPVGVSPILSRAVAAHATSVASAVATQQQQQGQQGKALSKHQKKKLKKIQDKYGDQDEEDRVLGAQVNGNQLSRVQLLELERLAAARQQEEEEKRRRAKAGRKAARDAGTLRYRPTAEAAAVISGDGNTSSEEEVVEAVSDFTDDDDEGEENTDNNSRRTTQTESPPPPPATDATVKVSGREKRTTAATSPTKPNPAAAATAAEEEMEIEIEGVGEDDKEHGSASQVHGASPSTTSVAVSTSTAARADRDAAVVQQATELHRALPHYTMRPQPTDTVQHVVAICAPAMVVNEYAYHVTLAMGNTKKGVLAGKLLQVFGERAQRGGVSSASAVDNLSDAGSGRKGKKAAKAHADPSKPVAADSADAPVVTMVNSSVVKALQMTSPNDIVEQLRANVKPVDFKI